MSSSDIFEKTDRFVMHTYGRRKLALVRGKGALLWDAEGKEYVDFVSGLGVNAVGHCNPAVVSAIRKQSKRLLHISNLYYNDVQAELAEIMCKLSPFYIDSVFFCNSGTEAVESALKLARKHTGKKEIIAMKNAFHGRTMGALSATWSEKYRKAFEPLVPDVDFAEFNNIASVKEIAEKKKGNVAAIITEVIQGEGGIVPAKKEFLIELRKFCDENGIMLIFDEVQTGFGRTGKMFAHELYGVQPDIMSLAKAGGGGLPFGAVLARKEVADSFSPGDHASTFGGNPLACSAALAAIRFILEKKLSEKAGRDGKAFKKKLFVLCDSFPSLVLDVRGEGLMLAMELDSKERCTELLNFALARGVLLCTAGENSIRFLPPLVIKKEQIAKGLQTIEEFLKSKKN